MLQSKVVSKFFNSPITSLTPSWTGSVQQISLPAQGTGESNRIGDNLGNVNLRFKGAISNANNHLFRFIVFQWLDINSATPSIGYILDSTRSGTVDFVLAPYAEGSKANYKILYDELYSVSSALPQPIIDVNVKCRNIDLTTASSVYAQTGSLYWLGIQDGSASLNSITGYVQLTYTEDSFHL